MMDTTLARRERYSQGAGIMRIVPAAVARPASLTGLREAIAEARERKLSVTPRGAGTAMDGGNIGDGMVIDMSAFEPGRCTIDAADRTARMTPSTPLAALRFLAAERGLRLPPEPSSAQWATLGGIVSTNAAGARTLRYGSIRPWVDALTIETSDGPLQLRRGRPPAPDHPVIGRWNDRVAPLLDRRRVTITDRFPKVRKNSAGYALDRWLGTGELIDLVIGSEGTLGVITDIVVRLDPLPEASGGLHVTLRDRRQLEAAIAALRPFGPSTLEFLDASFLAVVRAHAPPSTDCILLADFEADSGAVLRTTLAAARAAVTAHAAEVRVAADRNAVEEVWAIRHGASPALAALSDGRRSLQVIEDGCVPPAQLERYIEAVETSCRRAGIDVVIFGHAGDGHVHVNVLPNIEGPAWLDAVRQVYRDVSATVIALGGTPSGEHGAGRLRAPLMPAMYGPEVMECFEAVKWAFDPDGIFNCGVIIGSADPFATLKAGADATAIAAASAEWLDDIERRGAWGTER